jgi:hypothetical protein
VFGYSYGLISLYRTATYEPMSLPSAMTFLILAAGTLLARAPRGRNASDRKRHAGGDCSRLRFHWPFTASAFRRVTSGGEKAGWYSRGSVWLCSLPPSLFLFRGGMVDGTNLYRRKIERRVAEERVRQLNVELEQQVADRTAELNLLNQELRRRAKPKTISWQS